jgi:hypothetical protein
MVSIVCGYYHCYYYSTCKRGCVCLAIAAAILRQAVAAGEEWHEHPLVEIHGFLGVGVHSAFRYLQMVHCGGVWVWCMGMVYGVWCMVYGYGVWVWCMVYGVWVWCMSMVYGVCCMLHAVWCKTYLLVTPSGDPEPTKHALRATSHPEHRQKYNTSRRRHEVVMVLAGHVNTERIRNRASQAGEVDHVHLCRCERVRASEEVVEHEEGIPEECMVSTVSIVSIVSTLSTVSTVSTLTAPLRTRAVRRV